MPTDTDDLTSAEQRAFDCGHAGGAACAYRLVAESSWIPNILRRKLLELAAEQDAKAAAIAAVETPPSTPTGEPPRRYGLTCRGCGRDFDELLAGLCDGCGKWSKAREPDATEGPTPAAPTVEPPEPDEDMLWKLEQNARENCCREHRGVIMTNEARRHLDALIDGHRARAEALEATLAALSRGDLPEQVRQAKADHAKLRAEVDRLTKERDEARTDVERVVKHCNRIERERDEARRAAYDEWAGKTARLTAERDEYMQARDDLRCRLNEYDAEHAEDIAAIIAERDEWRRGEELVRMERDSERRRVAELESDAVWYHGRIDTLRALLERCEPVLQQALDDSDALTINAVTDLLTDVHTALHQSKGAEP